MFVDIPISKDTIYKNGRVLWLNPYTITAVGSGLSVLKSYYLRRQMLTIPELTEGEFTTLKENNGGSGNFYI